MGWSDRTYRYDQYKNALKLLNEAQASEHYNLPDDNALLALLHEKPQPRGDWSVWRTLATALRELLGEYKNVTMLEPTGDDDIHYRCANCGCEIQNSNWSNGESCEIEWHYCPECGFEFVSEDIIAELDVPVLRCENCGHLVNDGGYEYPEYACELGIDDNHPKSTGNGCCLTRGEREVLCRKIKEHDGSLWWDESK